MMNLIAKITYIIDIFQTNYSILKEIANLDVDVSGLSVNGVPYVKLRNGKVFYGFLPSRGQKVVYRLANWNIKKKVCVSAFAVASDIVIRYLGGGLKYKGPEKERYYSVKEGDTAAEMGAYLGYYIIKLSEIVGPSGKVIAIEPMPDNLELLRENIKANELNNVIVVPKGIWEHNGKSRFLIGNTGGQSGSLVGGSLNHKTSVEIEVASLDSIFDDLAIECVDFMVIQLNGAELEAIKGLTRIKTCNLAIAARYGKYGASAPEEIENLLAQRGYWVKIDDGEFIFASN